MRRVMTTETMREILVTAIALQRYELRHGKAAHNLNALIPEFLSKLPIDFMDGQPLRYRLEPKGRFLLYSVGEDGRDDVGDFRPKANSTSRNWLSGRDWIWPQPATAEEIAEDEKSRVPRFSEPIRSRSVKPPTNAPATNSAK